MTRRKKRPTKPIDVPWEQDDRARALVAKNPGGMTLKEVGDYFGLTRERIRQIEEQALYSIRRELGTFDPELGREIIENLARNRYK